jgi:uncharacterized protein involved in exopolysaccharide biosynthesis
MNNVTRMETKNQGPWLDQETLLASVKAGLRARWKVIAGLTLLTFALTAVGTFLAERTYVSTASLLVKKERIDAPVTPEQTVITSPERLLSEEELNSEVEVLRSQSLLEEVVTRLHLEREFERGGGLLAPLKKLMGEPPLSPRVRAQMMLEKAISIDPVKKSNVIRVSVQASDAELAARIADALCKAYQERHARIHRADGSKAFFAAQAEAAREKLAREEAALRRVSPLPNAQLLNQQIETQLRQLNEFEATLHTTRAAVAETEARIRTIEKQLQAEPSRLVSEERVTHRTAPEALRSQLFALEMKRAELLTKYKSGHRLVTDVEQDIAAARRLVAEAESAPAETESVTSLNALRQRLVDSLASERSALAALREKERSLAETVAAYASRVREMGAQGYEQRRLDREREIADGTYQLYAKKNEESRISEELDKEGIINVRLVEAARVPFKPVSPNVPVNLLMGFVGGLMLGLAAAYVLEYFNPTTRPRATPDLTIPIRRYREGRA